MEITVVYPYKLSDGTNFEVFENIENFQEKYYGVSFIKEKLYYLIPYSNILSFLLMEEDNNDT